MFVVRCVLIGALLALANIPVVRADSSTFDLVAVARKARPAVLFLTVNRESTTKVGTGTGFFVSTNGLLATNWHVIKNASSINAKDAAGHRFHVDRVVAEDPDDDVAILAIDGQNFPRLTLGSNENTEPGIRVALIGCPLGLEGTLSEGIVSALRDLLGKKMIQISNAMSSGSSGSPVVNANGEVIGVASGQILGDTEYQNISFAVPVEVVKELLARPALAVKTFDQSPRQQTRLQTTLSANP